MRKIVFSKKSAVHGVSQTFYLAYLTNMALNAQREHFNANGAINHSAYKLFSRTNVLMPKKFVNCAKDFSCYLN
jgi:hypothetical protein